MCHHLFLLLLLFVALALFFLMGGWTFYLRLFFFAFPPPPCCNEGLDIVTGAAAVAGSVCDDGEALSCAALLCILAIKERFRRSNLLRSCN